MQALVDRLSGSLVGVDETLEREFEAMLAESSMLVFRVAYGVLRNREDAEDVTQETFARAFARFRQLRDRDRFRPWLVRMTWRLAINRQRADRRRALREQGHAAAPPVETTPDVLASRERAEQLWRAIDALPERLRLVIVLGAIRGYDIAEVASLLGLREGTVKSRLFTARRQLRELLQWI